MPIQLPSNADIAALLEQMADLLEQQKDDPYRVQVFRRRASSVRALQKPLVEIVQKGGGQALTQIEGIDHGLAGIIFEFVQTGRSSYLQQLQARQAPEEILKRAPGIGERLAQRTTYQLGIAFLEALEQAAEDSRAASRIWSRAHCRCSAQPGRHVRSPSSPSPSGASGDRPGQTRA